MSSSYSCGDPEFCVTIDSGVVASHAVEMDSYVNGAGSASTRLERIVNSVIEGRSSVRTRAFKTMRFFLHRDDGTEIPCHAPGENADLRDGHRVTVVCVHRSDGASSGIVRLRNHTTGSDLCFEKELTRLRGSSVADGVHAGLGVGGLVLGGYAGCSAITLLFGGSFWSSLPLAIDYMMTGALVGLLAFFAVGTVTTLSLVRGRRRRHRVITTTIDNLLLGLFPVAAVERRFDAAPTPQLAQI